MNTTIQHTIEHDFYNELGQRVLILTCHFAKASCIANTESRCVFCGTHA